MSGLSDIPPRTPMAAGTSARRLKYPSLVVAVALASLVLPAAIASPGASADPPDGSPGEPAPLATAEVGSDVIEGEYVVVLERGSDASDVAAVARSAEAVGATVTRTFDAVLHAVAVEASDDALSTIRRLPRVRYVQPNAVLRVPDPVVEPLDTVTQEEPGWALDRIDQAELPLDDRYTHDGDGHGVRVYVLDSGVEGSHREFGGRVEAGTSMAAGETRGDEDCVGHGTSVAGAAAGERYGVAKAVTVVPVKITAGCEAESTAEKLIAGMEWVAENADRPAVVNISYGFTAPVYEDAVAALSAAGIAVVTSSNCQDLWMVIV